MAYVWFRGRAVVAIAVLSALGAGMATYGFFEYSGWGIRPPALQPGLASADRTEGLTQAELDKLNKAIGLIEDRFILPTDRSKIVDGAVQGMVQSLDDPFSAYLSAEDAEEFNDSLEGAFSGIGAKLRIDNGAIVVESPMTGSPAERAGLRPLDVLLSVNGESLNGLTLNDAVSKIRGPKGTKAKLKVQRKGAMEPLELELVRDRIDLESVGADIGTDGVGLLTINQFSADTSAQVAEALRRMEAGGLKALVVDVRDNPGGMLQAVIEVADQLLAKGKPIVQSEYRDGKRKVDEAEHGAAGGRTYPLVVLVNKGSASSAEIMAGALKQSGDATLVGETTYGKGTVQVPNIGDLGDRSMLKLTVYKWLLPDGSWINGKGIEPDVIVHQPAYFLASRLPRDRVLKFDETGEAVKNLQSILNGVGMTVDRSDGYFSAGTKEAVKAFQKREALPETGEVDAETAQRLEEALYEKLNDPANDRQLQKATEKARELAAR
ncbi:S41 family peptidase [Cohnella suwonensis]|uniref:S41 family peptidase n=1 Tax=Cohnella suwonensis TaxID=696072 RepID=A0ABW0LWN7_9BACL